MTGLPAEANAAAIATAGGPGYRLRLAREARSLSLAAVSEALHVEPRVIESLEHNRYTVFDAPVYARGFLRKYATYLDLPATEIVAAYDAVEGGPSVPTLIPVTASAPVSRDLSRFRFLGIALVALAIVAGAYWWWLGHAARLVAAAPATAHAPMPPPAAAPLSAPAANTITTVPIASADQDPLPPLPLPLVEALQAAAAAPAAAAKAPRSSASRVAAPAMHAVAATGGELVVTGLRDCWVEVYAPSGARLFYDTVHTGERRAMAGPGPWRVFLGNADGVRLKVGEHAILVPAAQRAGLTARFQIGADGVAH